MRILCELWNQHKSVATVSKITGIAYRAVLKRRKSIEERHDIMLLSNDNRGRPNIYIPDDQTQCNLSIDNGFIIVRFQIAITTHATLPQPTVPLCNVLNT